MTPPLLPLCRCVHKVSGNNGISLLAGSSYTLNLPAAHSRKEIRQKASFQRSSRQ